ncbi:TauD/TfdA family dioxygenase [Frankia sp. CiP3]|uniref:TauD/TfdA family dioxygenase n=1 Tax=Frankia sp. CiP3 TaxID=2880971 RepID=UPI001EF53376|nr:TauD/TfdA family dioxygenase [Frankia sp. CiP3]
MRKLQPNLEWQAADLRDSASWIDQFSQHQLNEIDQAVRAVRQRGIDLVNVTAKHFPLPTVAPWLATIGERLVNGRGFAVLRGVDTERYSREDLYMLFWGLCCHLGRLSPQNRHGHLLGDVTDHGRSLDDPTSRANEIGGSRLGFHSDATDVTALLCLVRAHTGGTSLLADTVHIHNRMAEGHPDILTELYRPLPMDFRGEEQPGHSPWYCMPVFAELNGRLFTRFVRDYTLAAQRFPDADRLTDLAMRGLDLIEEMANDAHSSVRIDLAPGDIQLVNNHRIIHDRSEYVDRPETGQIRHLKRIWLKTPLITERPACFEFAELRPHWTRRPSIARHDTITTRP